ncbi:MAG: bifunctional aldolase/short-chain dehydrogenase [Nannocystis sp.]|nr:bifunctional aldolase/short-chain dehydrogenase [Nannocystis sp.]MBA3548425.1 bifunctional aldolase/short-chain dehydrogenase [Nannocystis sp.]
MLSAWSDADARAAVVHYTSRYPGSCNSRVVCNEDLALRVYSSRLIGQEPRLVLHGGGNTSVKTTLPDDLGVPTAVACIKGSGWDLARIEPPGLPAVRLAELQALRGLAALGDEAMVRALRVRLLDPAAPNPSVEALLHAFLPHKFIDHSHADAVLAVVDQPDASGLCAEVFGPDYVVVPYVMPGFALAKLAAEVHAAAPACHGLLLLGHGLFSFGAGARESYERHLVAVTRAESFIARSSRSSVQVPAGEPRDFVAVAPLLRGQLGGGALHWRPVPEAMSFAADERVHELSQRGPVTPDHVIRTKQKPLVIDLLAVPEQQRAPDLAAALAQYRAAYRAYFTAQCESRGVTRVMLDPEPRLVLVPGLGMVAAGADEGAAMVAADLYEHTIAVIRDAEAIGRYQALPDGDIFDMEYWSLEQAKLGKATVKPLAGRIVYMTGAAAGIGLATARRFAAAGALLYLVDRDEAALRAAAEPLKAGFEVVDVTKRAAVEASIDRAVLRFGGIDGVVSNAGAAFQAPIATCPEDQLRASLELNLLAHQWVAAAAMRVLVAQGLGGFLLFNASKAAFNPGEGFGPYAVAKAGLVALMKQYALEGASAGVRANAVNADRVRTGLFSPEVVTARAAARGLAPDAYFRANLLGREVSADDVAEAFLALALAVSTTGAVLPVDGGNLAASPR